MKRFDHPFSMTTRQHNRTARTLLAVGAISAFALAAGCEKEQPAPTPPPKVSSGSSTATPKPADDHGHDHGDHAHDDGHDHADDGHDHADHAHDDGHNHGKASELGTQAAAGYTVKATLFGTIEAGKDCSVDFEVSANADHPIVSAVRLWVGTEDGAGSMKAKADAEGSHYHAHAEVPKPLPAGSKLWVQIENAKGETHTVSFEIKAAG